MTLSSTSLILWSALDASNRTLAQKALASGRFLVRRRDSKERFGLVPRLSYAYNIYQHLTPFSRRFNGCRMPRHNYLLHKLFRSRAAVTVFWYQPARRASKHTLSYIQDNPFLLVSHLVQLSFSEWSFDWWKYIQHIEETGWNSMWSSSSWKVWTTKWKSESGKSRAWSLAARKSHGKGVSQQRSLTTAKKSRSKDVLHESFSFTTWSCSFLKDALQKSLLFTTSTCRIWGTSRTKASFLQLQRAVFEGRLAWKPRFHNFSFQFLKDGSHGSFGFTTSTFWRKPSTK